jgi:hypothetical protein
MFSQNGDRSNIAPIAVLIADRGHHDDADSSLAGASSSGGAATFTMA